MSVRSHRRFGAHVHLALHTPSHANHKVAAPAVLPPSRPARPVALAPMKGASAKVIAARMADIEVWFVMDDSGSMYFTWGDTTGIRYAAAQSIVDLMRRSGGGRAGVIHWGSDAPAAMTTGPLSVKRDRKPLSAALTVPTPTLGANDLPAALRRAAERIGAPSPGRVVLILVITDGIEEVTASTHDAIAALPADAVHMVLVDRSGQCDERMEEAWRRTAFGSFTRLKTFNTREMAEQLAEVLAEALDLQSPADRAASQDDGVVCASALPPANAQERAALGNGP